MAERKEDTVDQIEKSDLDHDVLSQEKHVVEEDWTAEEERKLVYVVHFSVLVK